MLKVTRIDSKPRLCLAPGIKPLLQIDDIVLQRKLGSGSFSKVFLGVSVKDGKRYAVKKIPYKLSADSLREAKILDKCKHPNIEKLHKIFLDKKTKELYIILEYADCGSLDQILRRGKRFSLLEIQQIAKQAAEAISYLHTLEMVHQDVKPANLMMTSTGRVIVADFGIGHTFQSATTIVGTPAYQAPEALDEVKSDDPSKEDVWSLGVTLYQLYFRELPFVGDNMYEIIRLIHEKPLVFPPGTDPLFSDLLTKMLTVEQSERISMTDILSHEFITTDRYNDEEIHYNPPPTLPIDSSIETTKIDATEIDSVEALPTMMRRSSLPVEYPDSEIVSVSSPGKRIGSLESQRTLKK